MADRAGVTITGLTEAGAPADSEPIWLTRKLGDGSEYPLIYRYRDTASVPPPRRSGRVAAPASNARLGMRVASEIECKSAWRHHMSDTPIYAKLTAFELAGRVEWVSHALEAARREGRVVSSGEREVMDRYARGEISGDEARQEILRLFETPHLS